MSGYDQIAWLPLCGGLTALGLVLSWFAWRRRGAAAGLRGAAWSLLPLAAYLIGVVKLLWRFGVAIGDFAGSFVLSPLVWSGVIVVAVSIILFVVSGQMRRRRKAKSAGAPGAVAGNGRPAAPARPGAAALPAQQPKGKGKAAADDDMSDVEEILRRRGIR